MFQWIWYDLVLSLARNFMTNYHITLYADKSLYWRLDWFKDLRRCWNGRLMLVSQVVILEFPKNTWKSMLLLKSRTLGFDFLNLVQFWVADFDALEIYLYGFICFESYMFCMVCSFCFHLVLISWSYDFGVKRYDASELLKRLTQKIWVVCGDSLCFNFRNLSFQWLILTKQNSKF